MARGHEGLGGLKIGLATYGSGFAPGQAQTVSGVCPKDLLAPTNEEAAAVFELGVEVHLDSGSIGSGNSLDVTNTIDRAERVLTIPFGIRLCTAACPPNPAPSPSH